MTSKYLELIHFINYYFGMVPSRSQIQQMSET